MKRGERPAQKGPPARTTDWDYASIMPTEPRKKQKEKLLEENNKACSPFNLSDLFKSPVIKQAQGENVYYYSEMRRGDKNRLTAVPVANGSFVP